MMKLNGYVTSIGIFVFCLALLFPPSFSWGFEFPCFRFKPISGPHRFFLGPNVYYVNRSREGGSEQKGLLYGIDGGYDRIRRFAIYWGIEGHYANGRLRGKSGLGNRLISQMSDSDIEVRLGYTFQQKEGLCAFFTPFMAGGWAIDENKFLPPSSITVRFKNTYGFASLGFLSGAYLTPNWQVGLNFKTRLMLNGRCKISDDPDPDMETVKLLIQNKCHYIVELPVTYDIEESFLPDCVPGCFAISFVPFYQYRHYGERENFPFNFLDTKFKIYGAKLLLNWSF